jgi:predicted polyphosphate/ATP-dependent NAD kinase
MTGKTHKGEKPMKTRITIAAAALAVTSLAGCVEMPGGGGPGNSAEAAAREACVRDTRSTTGNPDVFVQSSSFSEAGTEVILTVGGTGTWRCIGYSNGTTAGIESLTNEGFL